MPELINPEISYLLQKDYENILNSAFNWVDFDTKTITERANFISLFNKFIPTLKLPLINPAFFTSFFPLKFIDLLTENINYNFGTPEYSTSWNFYTFLLENFQRFYIKRDIVNLSKIDSENIHTYSPFSRHYIRKDNQNNAFLKAKYFNKDFNLIKFVVKLVDKFVPSCTWRWVGDDHKCHIFSLKICKILVEYGFPNEEEFEDIKEILYKKVPIFLALEKSINRDYDSINETIKKNWLEGCRSIRAFYAEILIQYLYFKQDKEVLIMLKKTYIAMKKRKKPIDEEFMKNIISFQGNILFEEEFGRKMLDFLLGFIVSQNTIGKELLENRKSGNIVGSFLYFIANVNDPYLMSLKLIREEDYLFFMENYEENTSDTKDLKERMMGFSNGLEEILRKTMNGDYLYREQVVMSETSEILDKIDVEISFSVLYNLKPSLKSKKIQRILSEINIPFKVFNIMSVFIVAIFSE